MRPIKHQRPRDPWQSFSKLSHISIIVAQRGGKIAIKGRHCTIFSVFCVQEVVNKNFIMGWEKSLLNNVHNLAFFLHGTLT